MAMIDATSFDAALKEYYTDERVRDTVYPNNPLFAMLAKKTDIDGDKYVCPIQWGIAQSRSADITKVLANKKTGKYSKFEVTTHDDYAAISISRKVMKQSASRRGAFFEAKTREIDGMMKSLVRSISCALFRNGGGAIGQVSSSAFTGAGTTFTLNETEDVVNFEPDMHVVVSAGDGSAAAHALRAGGPARISAVDEDTGIITTDTGNWATQFPGMTLSDHLFVDGDFKTKLKGLLAWNPPTAPAAGDSHYGVDRTNHVTRLSGHRISATSDPIREGIRKAISRVNRGGEQVDSCFLSVAKYRDLEIELGNNVQYTETKAFDAEIGFTGIKLTTANGLLTVYQDHNCPDKYGHVQSMENLELISLGQVPELHDEDGVRMLRESNADAFEVRASYYAALAHYNTHAQCVLTLE